MFCDEPQTRLPLFCGCCESTFACFSRLLSSQLFEGSSFCPIPNVTHFVKMLRLAPTTIPLTRGEILQYEMRAEKRRQMRELLEQEDRNYVMHGGCSPDLHVDRLRPRIQRGPERRAKYYSNTHSSTSSSFNTIVNDDDATLDERSASSYARSESDIRRDSVLSSEGTGPSAPMSGPMGPLKQPRGYTADDSWINDALSSLQMPDVE